MKFWELKSTIQVENLEEGTMVSKKFLRYSTRTSPVHIHVGVLHRLSISKQNDLFNIEIFKRTLLGASVDFVKVILPIVFLSWLFGAISVGDFSFFLLAIAIATPINSLYDHNRENLSDEDILWYVSPSSLSADTRKKRATSTLLWFSICLVLSLMLILFLLYGFMFF